MADPTVPGFTITPYASVTDPEGLAFAPDGTLYVGRDDSGSNGSGAGAVKIHQVSPGGAPVAEYGDDALPDPDAVLFDPDGAISGITGAVIVGGSVDGSFSQGQLIAIAPNGAVSSLVSVGTNPRNPNQLIFDHTGRLLIADFGAVGVADGKVLALIPGGTPTTLITPPADPFFIAVDENDQIFVNTEDGNIRVYDATGVQVNGAFATGLGSAPMAFGPGGAFGHDLYTVNDAGNLLRIDQQGNQTVLGAGFGTIENLAFDQTAHCISRNSPMTGFYDSPLLCASLRRMDWSAGGRAMAMPTTSRLAIVACCKTEPPSQRVRSAKAFVSTD